MNDILSGTYKGNTYRIKVECYPNTPAIKVQLLPVNAGERITMTQNLGQPLPRYQAFLCDGMLEVDSTAFMDYMEENDLGYIVDYDWCFDGEPEGGVVAVSSVGTQQNKESKRLFLRGYEEMMKRLSPEWVIFYGKVPEECDWNVIRVKPHYDEIVKRRKANEISVSAGNT